MPQDIVMIDTIYGVFLSWEDDLITGQLRRYSAHTRNELAMIRSVVCEGDNVIDIGAHIGSYAIPFARFNRNAGKIFAFEANPDNFDLLKKNIDLNHLEAVVLPTQAIVSAEKGNFTLVSTEDRSTARYFYISTPVGSTADQESITVDEWYLTHCPNTSIHFIKIDVEGAEYSAIMACKGIIEKFKPVLYIEINPHAFSRFRHTVGEIESMLRTWGYHFFRNIGPRNSENDRFALVHLERLRDGGGFFDLLAITPSDIRYPKVYTTYFLWMWWKLKNRAVSWIKKRIQVQIVS
jgi:FkbM family methyltransferase